MKRRWALDQGKRGKPIPYPAVGGMLESLWTKSLGINLLLKGLHKKSKPPWVITLSDFGLGDFVGDLLDDPD